MKLADFVAEGNLGRSTADRVGEILRQAIIGRVFEAGERLVEAKIAQDLSVSITPVRQAFANLATQGLLTVFPYKGTYVTILTKESVDDLTLIRRQIELLAVDRAFANLKSEDAKQLINLSKLSDYHLQTGNLHQSIRYDVMCHEYFVTKADSQLLMEMWNLIKSRMEYCQTYTKRTDPPEDYIQRRHGDIISAVENMDKKALIEAVEHHISTAMRMVEFPAAADIQYK